MSLLMKSPIPYEPLKKNRFMLRFPSSLGISEYSLFSAARPKVTINAVEIPFLNTSTYVAGRFNWEEISVQFKDFIGPSTSQALMEWVRLSSESVTGRQGYAAGYKKDVELELLDPVGAVVQKWLLQGTFITSFDAGSLSMSDDEIATIDATLRMDRCILLY